MYTTKRVIHVLPSIAAALTLGGCAAQTAVYHASLGGFAAPSFKHVQQPRPISSHPKARSTDLQQGCNQAAPEQRLLCKCIINGKGCHD